VGFAQDMSAAFRSGADDFVEQASLAEMARARSAGDAAGEVSALCYLARVALRRGDYETCDDLAGQALTVARGSGDWRLDKWPLHLLASTARLAGDVEQARELFDESISLSERLGSTDTAAGERHNLGFLELHAGRAVRARRLLLEARDEAVRHDYPVLLPASAIAVAVVTALDGNHIQAAELLGAADRQYGSAGMVPDPDDAFERQTLRDQLIEVLGEDRFETQYAKGLA
jgi:tetratricopeptide (TPR) repeat protein